MPYQCEEFIEPTDRMCNGAHCNKFEGTTKFKRYCLCKTADGRDIPGCQVKGPTTPIAFQVCYNTQTKKEELTTPEECQKRGLPWIYSDCYCCCSCYAWDTKIAISEEAVRVIQEFEVGDEVLAASVDVKGNALHVRWQKRRVVMSSGTGPNSHGQEMIIVQYGEDGEIIVTPDQLFLLPDGKLLRADRLRFDDHLVDQDGKTVNVHAVTLGLHKGGIHHISTEFDPNIPITKEGHLLSSNGVITADFILQISQGTQEVAPLLAAENESRAVLGTQEYVDAAGPHASVFSSCASAKPRPIRAAFFEAHVPIHTPPGVPEWAPRFLTRDQAKKIAKAPHVPVTLERNKANFEYLKRVYDGFFPSIKLHLEWADEAPNLYAFRQFGVNIVYIAGRILRTKCIERDGLAFILAHGIARLLAISELDPLGYACTGAADFDAFTYVLPTAFYFQKGEQNLKALDQISTLFSFADMNQGEDSCNTPTLKCRLQAMQDALGGFPLPRCAGGVPVGELKLTSAEFKEVEGSPSVIATFNVPVMASSAQDVTKYTITPETVVTTALVDPEDNTRVVLTVTLPEPPDGDYTLAVHDILSADGSTLDDEHRTAPFHVGKGTRKPKGKR